MEFFLISSFFFALRVYVFIWTPKFNSEFSTGSAASKFPFYGYDIQIQHYMVHELYTIWKSCIQLHHVQSNNEVYMHLSYIYLSRTCIYKAIVAVNENPSHINITKFYKSIGTVIF